MSSFAFDFCSTTNFVTHNSNATPVTEADVYPTTRTVNGVSLTFGWVAAPTGQSRDRDNTADPRLASCVFGGSGSGGINPSFRVDLPTSGSWNLNLALGDIQNDRDNQCVVKDNTTTLATISGSTTSPASNFVDAAGTLRTTATWVSSNSARSLTFASTTCFLNSSTNGGASNIGSIAHALFTSVASGSPLTRIRGADGGMQSLSGGMNS